MALEKTIEHIKNKSANSIHNLTDILFKWLVKEKAGDKIGDFVWDSLRWESFDFC
jgi:hypothetical protein